LRGQDRSGIFSGWAQKQEPCQSIFLTHEKPNLYVKVHQKMTQRPMVAYLSLKRMSARENHDDIITTLGPDAVSYSSVTRYLREARFPPSKPEPIQPTFKEISMIQIRLF
jgi:hypothetical protein